MSQILPVLWHIHWLNDDRNTEDQPTIPINMLLNKLGEDSVDFLKKFQLKNSASSKDKSEGNSDCVDFWNILETTDKKSDAT